MIKIKIIKKKINAGKPVDHVPCPYNKLKLTLPVACKMNCNRFAGIDDGFVICGQPGANQPLPERHYASLWEVLRTYGHDDRGALV